MYRYLARSGPGTLVPPHHAPSWLWLWLWLLAVHCQVPSQLPAVSLFITISTETCPVPGAAHTSTPAPTRHAHIPSTPHPIIVLISLTPRFFSPPPPPASGVRWPRRQNHLARRHHRPKQHPARSPPVSVSAPPAPDPPPVLRLGLPPLVPSPLPPDPPAPIGLTTRAIPPSAAPSCRLAFWPSLTGPSRASPSPGSARGSRSRASRRAPRRSPAVGPAPREVLAAPGRRPITRLR